MFCADYIAAFVFHFGLNYGLWNMKTAKKYDLQLNSYVHGSLSGLFGAISVFPFDFVRQGAITSSKASIVHNLATVPYATVFFGLYFHQRDPKSLKSQISWATVSAGLAVFAELPFDKAKLEMMGSPRAVVFANSLFVPFGALLLVMYDKALQNDFCAKISKVLR